MTTKTTLETICRVRLFLLVHNQSCETSSKDKLSCLFAFRGACICQTKKDGWMVRSTAPRKPKLPERRHLEAKGGPMEIGFLFFVVALRQWRRANIALVATPPKLDCLTWCNTCSPSVLEDRFLPQQTRNKCTAEAQSLQHINFHPCFFFWVWKMVTQSVTRGQTSGKLSALTCSCGLPRRHQRCHAPHSQRPSSLGVPAGTSRMLPAPPPEPRTSCQRVDFP